MIAVAATTAVIAITGGAVTAARATASLAIPRGIGRLLVQRLGRPGGAGATTALPLTRRAFGTPLVEVVRESLITLLTPAVIVVVECAHLFVPPLLVIRVVVRLASLGLSGLRLPTLPLPTLGLPALGLTALGLPVPLLASSLRASAFAGAAVVLTERIRIAVGSGASHTAVVAATAVLAPAFVTRALVAIAIRRPLAVAA